MKMADEAVEIPEIIRLTSNNMFMVSLCYYTCYLLLYIVEINESCPTRLSSNY